MGALPSTRPNTLDRTQHVRFRASSVLIVGDTRISCKHLVLPHMNIHQCIAYGRQKVLRTLRTKLYCQVNFITLLLRI